MKGILPKYFDSSWSYARFKIPSDIEEQRWTCAFNKQGTSVYALGSDGVYIVAEIPSSRGNCKIIFTETIS